MHMRGFRVLLKRILKVTRPKCSRIMVWNFWAILFIKFTIEMTPPDLSDPKTEFPGFSLGNMVFSASSTHVRQQELSSLRRIPDIDLVKKTNLSWHGFSVFLIFSADYSVQLHFP